MPTHEPAAAATGDAAEPPAGARRVAAFFDVDGTLTRSDIVRDHVTFRRSQRSGPAHAAWMATLPLRALGMLALDLVSRTAVNRLTYSWYRGFARSDFVRWAAEFQAGPGRARVHPRGLELLHRHASSGHRLVFVTGAVDLLIEPLGRGLSAELPAGSGPEGIRIEAVRLAERDGHFTGELDGAIVGGPEKARRAREIAAAEGLDLRASYAYGDSIADAPLLEAVGRPAAVNPDLRLRRLARRRGWPVLEIG